MKNKEKIKYITIGIIVSMITSTITTYAATYLYNASEIGFDRANTELNSENVQGAIGELYSKATDYANLTNSVNTLNSSLTALTNRVSTLESSFGNTKPSYDVLYSGNLSNIPQAILSTYTYTTVSNLNKYEAVILKYKGGDSDYYNIVVNRSSNEALVTAINSSSAASTTANPYIYSCVMKIHVDFDNDRIGYKIEKVGSGWSASWTSFTVSNVIGIVKKM